MSECMTEDAMFNGHPCTGAREYGCKVSWGCTREDGRCEGSTRCSACYSEDIEKRQAESGDYDLTDHDLENDLLRFY